MPSFDPTNTAIVIVALIGGVMGLCAYLTLSERKVSAWMQDRLGPNRVGPGGLLQPLADGGKFFLKEEVIPSHVDKVFYVLAPAVAVGCALHGAGHRALRRDHARRRTRCRWPWPPHRGANRRSWSLSDAKRDYRNTFNFVLNPGLDIGVLYVFAIGSLAVYGVILAGWSANSKYSLLGSLRAAPRSSVTRSRSGCRSSGCS